MIHDTYLPTTPAAPCRSSWAAAPSSLPTYLPPLLPLQESLGGNARTSLVICVSDVRQHAEETLQSLQFGSRAMCVKNRPVVNERVDYRLLHAELQSQMDETADKQYLLEAVLF